MRKEIMDILACPICKGRFSLTENIANGNDVTVGSLQCKECKEVFPILDSIPNLLPPNLR